MKRIALSLLAFLAPTLLHAFSVSPMVVDFDPNATRSQQIFVLSNTTDREKPIEVSVAKPILNEEGIEKMDMGNGADDFIIIPQQFVLPPNSKRSVKAFYVGEPRNEEDTYRFVFKELPVALAEQELPEGESAFSMRIVMQYNTRVWLTPKGMKGELAITDFEKIEQPAPESALAVEPEAEPADTADSDAVAAAAAPITTVPMLRFTVANTGPAHGYIRYPTISLVSRDGHRHNLSKEDLELISGQVIMKRSSKDFKIRWQDSFPPINEIARIDLSVKERR